MGDLLKFTVNILGTVQRVPQINIEEFCKKKIEIKTDRKKRQQKI